MTDAIVDCSDVVKEYPSGEGVVRALEGVDIDVASGEFVSVVGPSGSGKSTLLNMLGLLDTPTSGEIRVAGNPASGMEEAERTRARRETIGFIFQSFHLIPTLTAKENVVVPQLPGGVGDDTDARAERLLERVGLGDRLEHQPDELSGGQKQRVAIARSLINRPSLVLADEPTGNLDRDTGREILELFREVVEEDDVAVVTVTHDEIVEEFTDRTIELIDGTIKSRTQP